MTLLEIFTHYGYTNQTTMLAEECGELVKAVNKYGRESRKANQTQLQHLRENIVEEMADVTVMLLQFREFFEIGDPELQTVIDAKISRQANRVESEKDKKV